MGMQIRSLLQRERAAIMGVINTTPDSFSDGGQFFKADSAVRHGLNLVEEGADILDIGGESTRPGAEKVSLQEEIDRVAPVIEALAASTDVPISIDSYKPKVMLAAVNAGACMINDVNGLRANGAIEVAAKVHVPVCIMHMQGQPDTMQAAPQYDDVVQDVMGFFEARIRECTASGIAKADLILDPGIGFGKTLQHNLRLLNAVDQIKSQLECDILIGVSRKSLIDKLFGRIVEQRLPASLGLAVQAVLNGAKIVRVHDVRATFDAIRAVEAVTQSNKTTS